MKAMQGDLAKIQKDHDALERRVGFLEDEKAEKKSEPEGKATAAATPAKSGDKPLKIVKLEPKSDATSEVEAPPPPISPQDMDDDDGPRPILKIGPQGAIEQSYPDDSIKKKPKVGGAKIDPQAAVDYDAAMELVKAKKLKQALDAFAGFIVRYPDHMYVANATYWRGECYYSLNDFASAVAQFDGLLARFPASAKVPDALLKLGMSQKKLGSPTKAKVAFDRLRKEFPLTDAAKKIPPEDK